MHRIYLDANGSCPPIPEVLHKVREALPCFGNPSSFHEHGRLMRAHIDEARMHVALALNARPKEVVFCSGAAEANRLFVDMLKLQSRKNREPLRILISPFEHPSLLKPILGGESEGYFVVTILRIEPSGHIIIDPSELDACQVLICCQAHNETGIVPPLNKLLEHLRPEAIVMSDIAQAFARLEALPDRVDVMTFSAQKMGALPGVGGAVFRGQAKSLSAPWEGGGQEGGFRPGTEAWLLIMALGEAAKYIARERALNQALAPKRDYFEEQILAHSTSTVIGKTGARLPNTSAVFFMGQRDPEALRIACDLAGLSVGFGSACSGLAPLGSFALKRMGLSVVDQKTCVRFSLPPQISQSELDEAIKRLLSLVLENNQP